MSFCCTLLQRRGATGLSILVAFLIVSGVFVLLPPTPMENGHNNPDKPSSSSSITSEKLSVGDSAAAADSSFMNNVPVLNRFIGGGPGGRKPCGGDRCDRVFSDVFSSLVAGYRVCLWEKIENATDETVLLKKATSDCLGDALWRLMDVKMFRNRDDDKQAILPPGDVEARGEWARCTEVTLGVGRDIEAELLLRQAQPHCRFFAADPVKEAGQVFKELGPYFEIAVAAEAGKLVTSIQEDTTDTAKYKYVEVKAVTLTDFLLHYANISKVDYLLIDNEGAEYKLLDKVIANGVLEANNISICQISAELHRPLHGHNMTLEQFKGVLKRLITKSSFVPVWSATNWHIRAFFLNVRDPYCVGKYFRSKWCGDFSYYKEKKK